MAVNVEMYGKYLVWLCKERQIEDPLGKRGDTSPLSANSQEGFGFLFLHVHIVIYSHIRDSYVQLEDASRAGRCLQSSMQWRQDL